MSWRLAFLTILTCGAATVGGCSTTRPPEHQTDPGAGVPVSSAAVSVSSVVNQLKCDVGAFLRAQDHPSPYFTVYNITGVLTFSLDRASAAGWSVAVAPSLPTTLFTPGLSANFSRSHSTNSDANDDLVLKFDMATQPDPKDNPHAKTAIDDGACQKGLGADAHLIDPMALKAQIEAIVLGAPKIGFETVEYHGKFVLTRSDDGKNTISLYIISGGFPSTARTSAYTQQFDITLQLQPTPGPKSVFVGGAAPVMAPLPLMMASPPAWLLHEHGSPARKPRSDLEPQVGSSGPPPSGLSEHLQDLLGDTPAPRN